MNETIEKLRPVFVAIAIIGALFKIMHWPGANIMLILGLGSLSLVHIVRGVAGKKDADATQTYIHYARQFGIAIVILAVLYKIMHWPGAETMLIAGAVSTALSYAAEFIVRK